MKKEHLTLLDDRQTNEKEALQKRQDLVQKQIEDLPSEKKQQIKTIQAEVDAALEIQNDIHFSDAAFAAEARSREAIKAGVNQPVGKIFEFNGNLLIKTPFNTVLPAQHYVNVLQDQVIGTTNEIIRLKETIKSFSTCLELRDSQTFFQLIKLAFKQLFNRGTVK